MVQAQQRVGTVLLYENQAAMGKPDVFVQLPCAPERPVGVLCSDFESGRSDIESGRSTRKMNETVQFSYEIRINAAAHGRENGKGTGLETIEPFEGTHGDMFWCARRARQR